jgi:alginate O-acetyltransferase complex protein AlgJ
MSERPDRELEALEEMARTEVRAPTATLLVALFLAMLPLVAIVERLAPLPRVLGMPVFRAHWPTSGSLANAWAARGWQGANDELRRGIGDADSWFERQSSLGRRLRPPVQSFMMDCLGYGNGLVRIGRDDWLFWEKELSAVAAPPFLAPAAIARAHDVLETDPATSIADFGAMLRKRGIALVVVPIPGKASIETTRLVGPEAAAATPLQNPSMPELARRLEAAGIELFDPAPLLAKRARERGPQYLRGDSHWRPEAMAAVAQALAAFVRERHTLPPLYRDAITTRSEVRSGNHDLIALLGFSSRGQGKPFESVEIRQVVIADEDRFARNSTAGAILLLGDSYSEIFSKNFESWGAGAGLADHLTLHLRRPVARLTADAGGSYDSRERLATELGKYPDFLDPIRVVIFEFAARELVIGRWREVHLPERAAAAGGARPESP